MTAQTSPSWQPAIWQQHLANSIRSLDELFTELELHPNQIPDALKQCKNFPLRVTQSYVSRMRKGDPDDPLLRQVLPITQELFKATGYSRDPVGDVAAMPESGLLHKYQGRALLVTTGACAIHCRYCFRRHYPYNDQLASANDWKAAINYIKHDDSLTEIILSGGDPLSLSNERLQALTEKLERIAHVKRLRIHTRLPIVLPERIDNHFIDWISDMALQPVMVIHANHANEINEEVTTSLKRLSNAGVILLNQSVLLRGVNDNPDSLAQLSEKLCDAMVTPYYLHLLDKVQGATHFAVSETDARKLLSELSATLPGYLVPRLVKEEAGKPGKTLLSPLP